MQTVAVVFAAIFLIGLLIDLIMKICEAVTARRKERAKVEIQKRGAIRMQDLGRAKERASGSLDTRQSESVEGGMER